MLCVGDRHRVGVGWVECLPSGVSVGLGMRAGRRVLHRGRMDLEVTRMSSEFLLGILAGAVLVLIGQPLLRSVGKFSRFIPILLLFFVCGIGGWVWWSEVF